ncbi:hypothetical protein ElyMa_003150300 [Elysia marginata]|uniref:Uncharacterized protein n=1 Tax=Elysia marginata TaxID=1093978 RepID=A0AAV4IVY6_9GAST|nr:hypothetical protein ElyMa_003150300 [Elysia marginata]
MDNFFLFPIDEDNLASETSFPQEPDEPQTEAGVSLEEEDDVFVQTPEKQTLTLNKTSTTTGITYPFHRAMKPPTSPTLPPPVSSSGAGLPSRSRRWSLDVISPLRLLNSHPASSSGRPLSTPESPSESRGSSPTLEATAPAALLRGRRYSQPIIPKVKPVKDKREKIKAAPGKKGGKGGHHKVKESYVVITLDTGQTIVVSFFLDYRINDTDF